MWVVPRIPELHRYITVDEFQVILGKKYRISRRLLENLRRDPVLPVRITYVPCKMTKFRAEPVYHLGDVLSAMKHMGYKISPEMTKWLMDFVDEASGGVSNEKKVTMFKTKHGLEMEVTDLSVRGSQETPQAA